MSDYRITVLKSDFILQKRKKWWNDYDCQFHHFSFWM